MLSSYISWAGSTRLKKPLSISLELSCVVRLLEYMGGAMRMDEPAELEKLKAAARRLASQLAGGSWAAVSRGGGVYFSTEQIKVSSCYAFHWKS